MENETLTQEQVNELIQSERGKWEEEFLNPLQSQVEELSQYKPKELSDDEKAIQQKQQELFQKEISLELKSAGLEDFAEFFNVDKVDDLKVKIDKFNKILNAKKIDNSFKPNDHQSTDKYSAYMKEKNTTGMISQKLSNIFK